MITKTEFTNKVVETLKDYYGKDADVTSQEVLKTNDVKTIGITIRFNNSEASNISPVIYIEPYYQNYARGKDFDSVIEDIVDVAELHNVPLSSNIVDIVADLSRWEFCKERVFPVLISTKRNQEMLKSLISKEFLDLSIIYAVRLDSVDDSMGTVKVSCDLMKTWGVSLEELHETAIENLQGDDYRLQDIGSLIADILGEDELIQLETMPGPRMMVMSCKSKMYAAAGVLDSDFMERVTDGKSFYMIPSSIHEWIMIPESDDTCVEELDAMIREVNETQVLPTEILSDHAYKYCNGSLMCA